MTAVFRAYPYRRSSDQDAGQPVRHAVVIVGGGPTGLALAIDLALRGVATVVVDRKAEIGEGSRAICFSKRTLEILDRLGVGDQAVAKGVTWQLGRVFGGDRQLYSFNLLPETGHKMPAFINLQQYYLESFLYDRAASLDSVDLRYQHEVTGLTQTADGVSIDLATPEGPYTLQADWVIACDGAKSTVRRLLGLDFEGQVFQDRFLIADVVMRADYPTERWFWFDPPFNKDQSALLHRQPDDVWRIDLQLGWDADPEVEVQPDRVRARLQAMLGDRQFDLEWVSVYTFQCRRLRRFVHDRVIFAGDSAHQVSPFGARGFNSGVQDTDNLAWKLAAILDGSGPAALLDSYAAEREAAADENILNSTRSTDFITPKSPVSRLFRDSVLDLAAHAPFARAMVNSGRLSTPSTYDTALSTPDAEPFGGTARLGAPLPDVPLHDPSGRPAWLLNALGPGFTVLHMGDLPNNARNGHHLVCIGRDLVDVDGTFAERFDARPGSTWVVRPDQHLCARFRRFDGAAVAAAIDRARGHMMGGTANHG